MHSGELKSVHRKSLISAPLHANLKTEYVFIHVCVIRLTIFNPLL